MLRISERDEKFVTITTKNTQTVIKREMKSVKKRSFLHLIGKNKIKNFQKSSKSRKLIATISQNKLSQEEQVTKVATFSSTQFFSLSSSDFVIDGGLVFSRP